MDIHEYQAKEIFAAYGIPVGESILCYTVEEIVEAYHTLNTDKAVIKAQVHTGGRGKAGGIKLIKSEGELKKEAKKIFGMDIKGFTVEKSILTEAIEIDREYYLSFTVDRSTKSVIIIMSSEGGVDIEQVAKDNPDKIHRIPIDPFVGIPDFMARKFALKLLDNETKHMNGVAKIIKSLYQLFVDKDASLAEINPLVITASGELLALDAKMSFDRNGLLRHEELLSYYEPTEEEKIEDLAKEKGFSYVHLDGDIGCMVNGAGLAMTTMDMIKLYGGKPANFLDIGGSSNPQKIVDAMTLLLQHPNVKSVLINIFGGITRCDDVAKGLITAFEEIDTELPVVVRLTGTNDTIAREMLENTRFEQAEEMTDAVKLAVKYQ